MNKKNFDLIKMYYSNPLIHRLIIEQAQKYESCVGTGQVLIERGWTFPVKEVEISKIEELMNDGLDLFFPLRSRDDKFLNIVWDIEYFDKKNPQFIFNRENQKQIFEWLTPSFEIVQEIFDSFRIRYTIDITMSGLHVWSKISTGSEAYSKMASEGYLLPSLEKKYLQTVPADPKRRRPVPVDLGKAYNCAGKLLEFFTHRLIRKNKKSNRYGIPVAISDSPQHTVKWPQAGLSSDLSMYAHPIYMRGMRAICSTHQKSLMYGHPKLGPAFDIVKTRATSYPGALKIMWDVNKAIGYFGKNFSNKKIDIPDASIGWLNAVNAYQKSELRSFHKEWEETPAYGSSSDLRRGEPSFAGRPPLQVFGSAGQKGESDQMAVSIAEEPAVKKLFDNKFANPALLMPDNLQMIADYFSKNGGLIAVKKAFAVIAAYYKKKNLGWYDPVHYTGINWEKYDADAAADFWGRAYWSLHESGLDRDK